MDIFIGSDHRGFAYKEFIKEHTSIGEHNITWHDVGAYSHERTDYVTFAQALCESMRSTRVERGILICGSGIGMSVVANRYQGIYAGLLWDVQVAAAATQDDHINVVVLPSDFITKEQGLLIISTWLTTSFKPGRYQQRIDAIDALGGV